MMYTIFKKYYFLPNLISLYIIFLPSRRFVP